MSSIQRIPGVRRARRLVPNAGLWRDRDFLRLWTGESISEFGNQISALAIPLIAVLTLNASPLGVGVLAAIGQIPALLFGLLAGAWIDRFRKRPLLIAANLGSAAALALIPAAAVLGMLNMPLLCAISFVAGSLSLVFDISYVSYLPRLVGREQLVEANSKLQASSSVAQVGGPGLGGLLVGLLTAPYAILLDALSFVSSALLIGRIATSEAAPESSTEGPKLRAEIGEGLRFVMGHRVMRALVGRSATDSFFSAGFFAVYLLYLARELRLGPTTIGLILAFGGVGAFTGALLAAPLLRKLTLGPAFISANAMFGLTGLLIPLAVLAPRIALPMVVASEFLQWLFYLPASINGLSLRQAVTPDRMQGRVNGAYRFLSGGLRPLGSLAGGALGALIGLPLTLVICEIGFLTSVCWLFFSPIRDMRTFPSEGVAESAAQVQATGEATA